MTLSTELIRRALRIATLATSFRCQCGDQGRVWTEEEIADCRAPAVSDPALCQMVRPIVQHVAALTERTQILQSIVGRITAPHLDSTHSYRPPGVPLELSGALLQL
jgi:hypothetical protein